MIDFSLWTTHPCPSLVPKEGERLDFSFWIKGRRTELVEVMSLVTESLMLLLCSPKDDTLLAQELIPGYEKKYQKSPEDETMESNIQNVVFKTYSVLLS
jgi:hypothetical protein